MIMVTHDQAEAMTLADRVVVLREGRVQQIGPPREIYARPKSAFVASFFGSPAINLFDDDSIGVRPEKVTIAREGTHAGKVVLIEALGGETWITIDGPRGRITGRGSDELSFGDEAYATWDAADELRF